jgi:tRNA pseudouridine38-40 synthase
MRNIKLIVAYDGTDFSGWQRQNNYRSVQGELEAALTKLHKTPVTVNAAGRTDAGVHAAGQCANFFTTIDGMSADRFAYILNGMLPKDVRIVSSVEAPQNFHARFDARVRSYRYYFICARLAMPHENRYAMQLCYRPSIKLLNAYACRLHGETDCSLFASTKDLIFKRGSGSKCRNIKNAYFFYEGDKLIFEISANAFFWKMVRSIAGTLLFYEQRNLSACEFSAILKEGCREKAGNTIPPTGLFLWQVDY